jgi:diacylglycerol kinase (ATP)
MVKYSKFSILARVNSFRYAFRGLGFMFQTEQNSWIHLFVTIVVIAFGIWFHISATEWCFASLAIGLVFMAEMVNTAFEKLLDLVHPEEHPMVGKIKDLAAGTVLATAVIAIAVGLIIFLPKIIDKLGWM